MATLDNAIWLTGANGAAQNGSTTLSEGGNSTIVTGVFTPGSWDSSQSGYQVSDFGAFGVSEPITASYGFSNPVSDLRFDLQHVNSNGSSHDDKFTLRVLDASGVLIPAAQVIAGLTGVTHHQVTINADGTVSIEGEGSTAANIGVAIDGPISQLDVTFDNGSDASISGGAGLSDFTFSIPPALDYVVEGTDAGERIDIDYLGDPEGDRVDSGDAADGSQDDVIVAGGGNDTVLAGEGDDFVDAGTGDDSVEGGAGNDTLSGGGGRDLLQGGAGNDLLQGGIDGDTLEGGAGRDTLEGGAGNDSLSSGDDNDLLLGGDGDDTITAGYGDDTLYGGDGNDRLEGLYGNDLIYAGEGDDHVFGRDQDDLIYGEGGNDTLIGSMGTDTVWGGAGNDILAGSQGNDEIHGGDGDDLAFIGVYEDSDRIFLDDGNDFLDGSSAGSSFYGEGGRGDDVMNSGVGNDTLLGGEGYDRLSGGAGDDSLDGGSEDDVIEGGSGADTLIGGTGADSLYGDDDRDLFVGGAGDVVDGGEGGDDYDRLDISELRALGGTRVIYTSADREDGRVEVRNDQGDFVSRLTFSDIEEVIPCFTPGSLVLTPGGAVPVEALEVGDRVVTRDGGPQTLRWTARRIVTNADLARRPQFQPILIEAGALGSDGGELVPNRDLMVSPQHRMMLTGSRAELLFGSNEVLVAAVHLLNDRDIRRARTMDVTYIHLLFDQHEIVCVDGAWSESFQPGDLTLSGMDAAQRSELCHLFPELESMGRAFPTARRSLRSHEARVLLSSGRGNIR
ncbi:Hint domain-containing protein [Phaeobacter porticola]|uniref:RTX toxin n=1 Tax=Phaeobacter porticola TaxID=1844006 RepID=A0A1L3I6U7_9RHOB|nr:Hint domain-containing protein [Phaeobacter porticola]APG47868.1 RTX toxin [Phaeobacter porticola]